MVIDAAVSVYGVLLAAHGVDAGLEGAGPFLGGVVVGADVGVFVRALICEVGDAVDELCTGVVHGGDGIAVAVVGEVFDGLCGCGKGDEEGEEDKEFGELGHVRDPILLLRYRLNEKDLESLH